MATGGREIGYGKDVEEYTNCPCRCFITYEDPWYIQCGHTMSRRCIRRQQPIIRCLVCDESFLFASSKLSKNRFANDLAVQVKRNDIIHRLRTNQKCSLQPHKGENAESYCGECNMKMCLSCSEFHNMNPKTKRHAVYEVSKMIGEDRQSGVNINSVSMCEHHDDEVISQWCLDCKRPACKESCSQHNLESLSRQATDSNTKIQKIEENVKNQLSTVKLQYQEVKKISENMKTEGEYHAEVAAKLKWAEQKCEQVIKTSEYLLLEVTLLLEKGNEFHKCYSLQYISLQIQRIQETTASIKSDSQCDSARSSASSTSDHSLSASYVPFSPGLSRSLDALSDRRTYINVNRKSRMDALYANEQMYADVSQIESIIKVSSHSLARSTLLSDEIQGRLNFFDTGARITGMAYVNGTIVVASQSAGICTGYDLHGKIQWDITEKLNGPFDVAAHKTDDDKQFLYITDPGRRTASSEGTIHVFKLRKNDRYSFEKKFTKECSQPRGICVASSRVYVCEPEKHEITEYNINKSGTGKILHRCGKGDVFLKHRCRQTIEQDY